MPNNRIYWAVKAIGLAPYGNTSYTAVKGVQSVGMSLDFNLVQVFELGQLALYENIEQIPDVQVTIERVLDGTPLAFHLATRGRLTTTLAGRSAQRTTAAVSIFGDTQDSASGTPVAEVTMSGLYVSSIGYQFPVDGNATESVTLVGNNRTWKLSGATFTGGFLNTDTPVLASGGVQRRENFIFDTPAVSLDTNGQAASTVSTILPPQVPGITSSGTNGKDLNGNYACSIQSVNVTADLGRDAIYELGHKSPYFRFVNFPVEVNCDIEIIAKSGDLIGGTEAGLLTGVNAGNNLQNSSIRIYMQEGTNINLGTNCKLASVNEGGADAGGGNETVTYKFTTFNDFTVTHPQDPG